MSDFSPGDFTAGFVARHRAAPAAIDQAMAPPTGFTPTSIGPKARRSGSAADAGTPPGASHTGPVSFSPQNPHGQHHSRAGAGASTRPRHFAPANPAENPTEGWDPLDPDVAHGSDGGFVDPVAAARAAGFAEGQAAAMADAVAEVARDRALVVRLAEALGNDDRVDRAALARHLRQTVMFLVAKIIGETEISGDLLASRVAISADMLADRSEASVLRLNPADLPLVEGRLPRSVHPQADGAVARGSFILESASTMIEDGPEIWLEQLARAIDRIGLPAVVASDAATTAPFENERTEDAVDTGGHLT